MYCVRDTLALDLINKENIDETSKKHHTHNTASWEIFYFTFIQFSKFAKYIKLTITVDDLRDTTEKQYD
jgi:hypothetical protein